MSRRLKVIALLLVSASTAAAQPTATEVLDAVDVAYLGTGVYTFSYRQVTTDVNTGATKTLGRMWVERPGKLRWETHKRDRGATSVEKIFINDGVRLTTIDQPSRTITQAPICSNLTSSAMTFLTSVDTLASAFTPVIVGKTKRTIDLELTPINSSTFAKLVLTVDARVYLVEKSVVTDHDGNTIEVTISDEDSPEAFPEGTFDLDLKAIGKRGHYKVTKQAGSCPTTAGPSGSGSGAATGAASGSNTTTE